MKYFMIFGFMIFLIGCSNAKQNGTSKAGANPADVKCISDGYELKAITKNGVPVDSICINKDTGKKCIAWEYYRGECTLK